MNSGVAKFRQEAIGIDDYFPGLEYFEGEDKKPVVIGKLNLIDDQGHLLDIYSIKVCPTSQYPLRFPHVFEIGNRIPINIDWHVFEDGHCCIKSVPEEMLICKKGITLPHFIESQVMPYFFNQKFREQNGYFLNERSHGIKGNIEFFEELFHTKDLTAIVKGLIFISQSEEPTRVHDCFCGSGLKYRKCHREAFRLLSRFTREELHFYIRMIIAYASVS